jgi:transcriptional regulator with XRE-family HTH domain
MTKEYIQMIDAIKQGRKQRGFTQDDFAKMLNLTKVTYQRYESLQFDMPTSVYMLACQLLHINLFERKEDETKLIAINPDTMMDRFNNVATKDDVKEVSKNVKDMDKKLDEILKLFGKK